MNMVITSMAMPPKIGIAIGPMTSAPRPVALNIGNSASTVVAVVIRQGRTRRSPPSITRWQYYIFWHARQGSTTDLQWSHMWTVSISMLV